MCFRRFINKLDSFKKSLKTAQAKLGAGTATGTAKHNKLLLAEKKLALANKNATAAVATSSVDVDKNNNALNTLAASDIGKVYQTVNQLLSNNSNLVSELNGVDVHSVACSQLPGTVDVPIIVPGKSDEVPQNEYLENLKFLMSFTDTELSTRINFKGKYFCFK